MRLLMTGLVAITLCGGLGAIVEGRPAARLRASELAVRGSEDQPGSAAPGAVPRAQIMAEAERIRAQHRGVPPRGTAIDPVARRRADESFRWLATTGRGYRADALVMDSLMRTYGLLGGYYAGYYPAGAWLGYAGANRWARRQWLLYPQTAEIQDNLSRYALGWASIAYANGSWFWQPPGLAQSSVPQGEAPGLRETAPERVTLPEVDEAALSAEQRTSWREVRNQFVLVSSRVHEARVLLDGMAQRLSQRGLSLNAQDGGTALSMQGFLVDAADFINERDFERARQALTRVEYERNKLRGTTGQ